MEFFKSIELILYWHNRLTDYMVLAVLCLSIPK